MHIAIVNSAGHNCFVFTRDGFRQDYSKKGNVDIFLNNQTATSQTFNISKPQFITFFYLKDSVKNDYLIYRFFLTPGDNISFAADFSKKGGAIVVTGKGSNNNQPLLGNFNDIDLEKLYGDTIPYRIIDSINLHQKKDRNAITRYIKKYNPSASFVKSINYDFEYKAVTTYYRFKESTRFVVRDAYFRNYEKWQSVSDSLFKQVQLNNSDALSAKSYTDLLNEFLLREKERLWYEANSNPTAFYKEWYNTDITNGQKLFYADQQNLLQEKIINKYFSGDVAEYLYGALLDGALNESEHNNIVDIFNRFKKRFPESKYVTWFAPFIDAIDKRQHLPLSADMLFVTDNGTKLNTFDEVLALNKGKTILLDMWGTWCAPCREEINKNSAAIKEHFKDKGLTYVYVANFDEIHEKEWKSLIAYFDLKGTHILANGSLSRDIMTKVGGHGYPTYVVIKRDGTYQLSKAGYPMDRNILIKQLEDALAL